MNDIENGIVNFNRNIWGNDHDNDKIETYFTPYIIVDGIEQKGDDYDHLKDAKAELEKMQASNKDYDDAFIVEYYENGDIRDYY